MNISIDEFSSHSNPALARAGFLLDGILEDISEEWGYNASLYPRPHSLANAWLEILFIDYKQMKRASFIVFENGNISRIKSKKHVKTGGVVYNDDEQILAEIKPVYELYPGSVGQIVGLDAAISKDDLENIAVQLIEIIIDSIS
jgi:hypothetical protein